VEKFSQKSGSKSVFTVLSVFIELIEVGERAHGTGMPASVDGVKERNGMTKQ
jgi:hypothetical protein